MGSMKVLNLRCAHGHTFEGWFGSEDDFLEQNGQGLVECPLCADKIITRMPTAPRLNLSNSRRSEPSQQDVDPVVSAEAVNAKAAADLQAMWLQTVRHVLDHTDDVGDQFAQEARRIHFGEAPERGIRGQASPQEQAALREEGIEVMALPIPAALKGPVQ